MKTHYPNFHDRPNSQLNEDSYSDSSVSKFSTSELKLRRPIRASYAESIEDDIQTAVTSNGKLSANKVQPKASNDEETTTARYNPAVRTLFSCLILMGFGLFLLYLAADGEIFSRNGHWRFKFGPQLRYVSLFLKDYKFIMSIFLKQFINFCYFRSMELRHRNEALPSSDSCCCFSHLSLSCHLSHVFKPFLTVNNL